MSIRKVCVEAPSNIALIKYMGKTNTENNLPSNASISWTLNHLVTKVEISVHHEDAWEPLYGEGLLPIQLSVKGQSRFLSHLKFLKNKFNVTQNFLVRSANNFPSDCGLASSASSFAALTKATLNIFFEQGYIENIPSAHEMAELSRRGSGSSCRSFFSPWSVWDEAGAREYNSPINKLNHAVIVVESGIKEVSSSEAHKRVTSSPFFAGRIDRVNKRIEMLLNIIADEKSFSARWIELFQIIWDEFEDMHRLFETSQPSFKYKTDKTEEALKFLLGKKENQMPVPLVTMDAGANIHLLFTHDQNEMVLKYLNELKSRGFQSLMWTAGERVF